MQSLTTIIYYTSSHEDDLFEQKVRDHLLQVKGNLPIISVSQRPIDFGHNICVGDIGASESNVWVQMLVGCLFATTPFVTFAEADTLYPPEYFSYKPKDVNKRYWFEDVYILHPNSEKLKDHFYLKGRSDCAHMAGRAYIIRLLSEAMNKNTSMKYKGQNRPERIKLKTPIINIKTGDGLRPKTQVSPIPHLSLPYWGTAVKVREEIC